MHLRRHLLDARKPAGARQHHPPHLTQQRRRRLDLLHFLLALGGGHLRQARVGEAQPPLQPLGGEAHLAVGAVEIDRHRNHRPQARKVRRLRVGEAQLAEDLDVRHQLQAHEVEAGEQAFGEQRSVLAERQHLVELQHRPLALHESFQLDDGAAGAEKLHRQLDGVAQGIAAHRRVAEKPVRRQRHGGAQFPADPGLAGQLHQPPGEALEGQGGDTGLGIAPAARLDVQPGQRFLFVDAPFLQGLQHRAQVFGGQGVVLRRHF